MSSDCECCVDTDCTCAANSCVCHDYTVEEKFAYIRQMLETGLDFSRDIEAGEPVTAYAGVIHQGFKKALNSFDEVEAGVQPEMMDCLLDIRQAAQDLVYYLLPQMEKANDPVLIEQVEILRELLAEAEDHEDPGE